MNLNLLAKKIHTTAREKGWYDAGERNKAELIALIHAELSEALEELRNGHKANEVYFSKVNIADDGKAIPKPEGFPIEIADVIIRILDMCAYLNVDIEEAIEIKMEFNKNRGHKHGKQF